MGDNIKMYVGVEWINLVQDRDKRRDFVKTIMNLRFPQVNENV
jgi:hypothetical protein